MPLDSSTPAHSNTPAAAVETSVILPSYNRAGFLPAAFRSIGDQDCASLEVIVVDDGSTDDTRRVVEELAAGVAFPVRYVLQANQGAYAARNTGLDQAAGTYLAFFDSDDLWLPHHLSSSVDALRRHPELDWVFGACRRVEFETGRVLQENTFYLEDGPRPFLSLHTLADGDLRIIDDQDALDCQLLHGLYCGLQNSVIHKRVFASRRFWPKYRVVEDELFVIRLLNDGGRFAYFDRPHVIYHVHGDNSSAAAADRSDAKALAIFNELIEGFEQLRAEVKMPPRAARALAKRLSREYFWHLGYQGHWQRGRRSAALDAYHHGLRAWPWEPAYWKTYLLALVRSAPSPSSASQAPLV